MTIRAIQITRSPMCVCIDLQQLVSGADPTISCRAATHTPLPRWVMYGRCPRCKRNLTISEAFGCGHLFGLT